MSVPRCWPMLLAVLAVSGCNVSDDPAQGGFLSGVAGLSQGTYEDRIAAREAEVAQEQRRQAALRAELAGLQDDYARLQRDLARGRAAAATEGKAIPPALDAGIDATLDRRIGGTTEAERIARYRQAVADARRLSEQLAGL